MDFKKRNIGCIVNRRPSLHSSKASEHHQQQQPKSFLLILDLSHRQLHYLPKEECLYQSVNTVYTHIETLNLNNNYFSEIMLDHKILPVGNFSIASNKLNKFTIKQSISQKMRQCLKCLNVSNNFLSFLDLELLDNLQVINCSHNNMETLVLPQSIENVNVSYNQLASIQYSLLSAKIHKNLQTLDVSHNRLYDLILSINGHCLSPNLSTLCCQDNAITYIEGLSPSLQELHLDRNQIILDRMTVNAILKLHNLSVLTLEGNVCSREMETLLSDKLGQAFQISHEDYQYQKQSPYKIYRDLLTGTNINNNNSSTNFKIQPKSKNLVFTLGDANSEMDSIVDPDYQFTLDFQKQGQSKELNQQQSNLGKIVSIENQSANFKGKEQKYEYEEMKSISIIPESIKYKKLKERACLQYQQKQNNIQNKSLNNQKNRNQGKNKSLQKIKSSHKGQKFKASTAQEESYRFQNHYKQYMETLLTFSYVPCRPFRHSERNETISLRIDPTSEKEEAINQFHLFNEMFQKRGGVHYVRKISRLCLPVKRRNFNQQLMFLNRDLNKNQFQKLKEGHYQQIEIQNIEKHQLTLLPSSFTCYHVALRVSKKDRSRWFTAYLVEAQHL